jgi:hypothetical protein
MARLGRAVSGDGVLQNAGSGGFDSHTRSSNNESVQDHRYRTKPGLNYRAGDGHQFGSAAFAEDLQRRQTLDPAGGRLDRRHLSLETSVVYSSATARPKLSFATKYAGADNRGGSGVADSHLTQDKQPRSLER